jgi:hypothetical protein
MRSARAAAATLPLGLFPRASAVVAGEPTMPMSASAQNPRLDDLTEDDVTEDDVTEDDLTEDDVTERRM